MTTRKVHLALSIESIAFLSALAAQQGTSLGRAADYILTAARTQDRIDSPVISNIPFTQTSQDADRHE